jgi:hypothetical protein
MGPTKQADLYYSKKRTRLFAFVSPFSERRGEWSRQYSVDSIP